MHAIVKDVMTSEVTSVNGSTPFKDIAEILIFHGVSAVPVVDGDNHVVGVVSEADLLHKEEFREQYYREGYQPPLRVRLRHRHTQDKARGDTAAELMTSPAVTVTASATVVAAARLMDEHDVKRLPVVDGEGCLVGIVSRHDLLKVFVRTDDDIAREIRDDVLGRALLETSDVRVHVAHGMVTLTGHMDLRSEARIAARLARRVSGVVDVIDKLEWKQDDPATWNGR